VHIGVPGTLLGILDDVDITETDLALGAGDVVLLYTDGVPDGRRGKDFYGEERLHRFVNAPTADAAELVQGLLADVITFQGGLLRDDVALVAVRVPPDSPQA
jgi:sigma-B regulation protein RsbU (phosphoserine phosphatase)